MVKIHVRDNIASHNHYWTLLWRLNHRLAPLHDQQYHAEPFDGDDNDAEVVDDRHHKMQIWNKSHLTIVANTFFETVHILFSFFVVLYWLQNKARWEQFIWYAYCQSVRGDLITTIKSFNVEI